MKTAPDTDTAAGNPLARATGRLQNLRAVATLVGLLLLLWLVNLTPIPRWLWESFEMDADTPASLLGRAYWDDCFGGPLGTLAAGALPRPETLSYAPEADEFLAQLENLAAQEEQIENVEAAQEEAAGESAPDNEAPAESA
ncbi:hypothetical protein [uncultured Adlercreutzia sp.]|uniref:hypothetical protein n=1 Tax=uncultured Adlercreutzia sp. TaxID=875803 RepID=UPI0026F3CC3D|nr:hypothetical protein [uncultured Adlercreutzia sp.]